MDRIIHCSAIILFLALIIISDLQPIQAFDGITNMNKDKLIYEVNDISIKDDKLIIKGWAFIDQNQHYSSPTDHDYAIYFIYNDEFQIFEDVDYHRVDQTENQRYGGARKCYSNEYNQKETSCYYDLSYVGFDAKIPLSAIDINKEYQIKLVVKGITSKQKGIIDLYYPIKQTQISNDKYFSYHIKSDIRATSLQTIFTNIRARSGPGTNYPQIKYGSSCSYSNKNSLFHMYGNIYKNIYDKAIINDNTWYKVKGRIYGCVDSRQRMVEGYDIDNVWLLSNFVIYDGEPLTIKKTSLYNQTNIRFVDNNYLKQPIDDIWQQYKEILTNILK
ncbi:MAG: hypothetical protein WBO70_07650 [Erysipelotrichaceae bacterium]